MCLFLTLLYSFTSGAFFFIMALKYTHDPSFAGNLGALTAILVVFLGWPAFYIIAKSTQRQTALPGWQTAPILSYHFETRANEGRTLRLSELNLTADERADLQRFAERRAKNENASFSAGAIATYRTLKPKLMDAKWLEWIDPKHHRAGVMLTDDGKLFLEQLLPDDYKSPETVL